MLLLLIIPEVLLIESHIGLDYWADSNYHLFKK